MFIWRRRKSVGVTLGSVWRKMTEGDKTVFVPRCAYCGNEARDLRKHWFFRGFYCIACIQDVLYANVRNIKEVSR